MQQQFSKISELGGRVGLLSFLMQFNNSMIHSTFGIQFTDIYDARKISDFD